MKKILGILLSTSLLAGCVPAMIGGHYYNKSKDREARREFTNSFQHNNLEREAKGLKPLDWCSEAYKFDAKWAKQDPQCRIRVEEWENTPKLTPDLDMIEQPTGTTKTLKKKHK